MKRNFKATIAPWMFTAVLLTSTTGVLCQIYKYNGQELTQIPQDVPADAVDIRLIGNDINSFPDDAFDKFYQLRKLYMGKNPFTELPNLQAVSDTLLNLNIKYCQISKLNETRFSELKVIWKANFQGCKLTSFPSVHGPVNTLRYIGLSDCKLTRFPAVNHYKALDELYVGNNPMTSVQDSDVDNLQKLSVLHMNNVPLNSLPNNPKALQTVQELDVSSSNVSTVPLTCPRKKLNLTGQNSNVSLCSCENVWLKAVDGQRGSVQLDDMTCGDAVTTEDIVQQQCQRPQSGDVREISASLKHADFFCQFPVSSYVTYISKPECIVRCWETLGCSSISFRSTNGRLGNCAVIAPTDSALTDISDADSAGWIYYSVKGKSEE